MLTALVTGQDWYPLARACHHLKRNAAPSRVKLARIVPGLIMPLP